MISKRKEVVAPTRKPSRVDQGRYLKLISYLEVQDIIHSNFSKGSIGTEICRVDESLGRICANTLRSKRNIPARDISSMDGYALRSSGTAKASVTSPIPYRVKGKLFPDHSGVGIVVGQIDAYYAATGSPIPKGADSVVRVEETKLAGNEVLITRPVVPGKNIALKGEDVKLNDVLLEKGDIINSADVALLIAAGVEQVTVYKKPRAGVLSIGDELERFSEKVQGKTVNNYANLIAGYISGLGADVRLLGISKDDPGEISQIVRNELPELDMVITIGGSSVGVKDHAFDALIGEDYTVLFHGIRIVPVRPTGVGIFRNKPIIILPGHAVSAALSFFLIALPVINIISGLDFNARTPRLIAVATERLENDRTIDALHLVKLRTEKNGRYSAIPMGWGSNLMLGLAEANGYVLLKKNQSIRSNEEVVVTLLGSSELARI